jgi:AcrR family transcriptional regulator
MARPRADAQGPSARERIVRAFWDTLAERPFPEMTVAGLCSRADVNHNTFYYHFGCVEDLARCAFEENMLPELPRTLLPALAGGAGGPDLPAGDADVLEHFGRARLFASSGSPLLSGLLRDSVMELWMQVAGVDAALLSEADRDRLSFAFGGLVAAIGAMGAGASPSRMAAIAESPLGRGLFETLAQIAARCAKPDE